jgi:hypothetical protein
MALAFVQAHGANVTDTNTTVSVTVSATGTGNLLVVCPDNFDATPGNVGSITGVSDGTNAFTQVPSMDNLSGTTVRSDVWYLPVSTSGKTTITATFSRNTGSYFKSILFIEISGFTNPVVDVHNVTNTASCSANQNGAAVTTTATVAAIVAFGMVGNITANPHSGNAFTSGGTISSGDAVCSLLASSTGTYTPAWDMTAGNKFWGSTVAFKESTTAYTLTASGGTYTISGTAATLAVGRKVSASSGTYTISGTAAGLKATRKLSVANGTYSINGSSATLSKGYTLSVSGGSYVITGTAVGSRRTYVIASGSTNYDILGGTVTLNYSAAKVISEDTGEHPDQTETENYFRRYCNDRDALDTTERLATETIGLSETSTDNDFESYVRRYGNDNA